MSPSYTFEVCHRDRSLVKKKSSCDIVLLEFTSYNKFVDNVSDSNITYDIR